MTIDNIVDTLLNLGVFVFIGILIWLYFKKEPDGSPSTPPGKDH